MFPYRTRDGRTCACVFTNKGVLNLPPPGINLHLSVSTVVLENNVTKLFFFIRFRTSLSPPAPFFPPWTVSRPSPTLSSFTTVCVSRVLRPVSPSDETLRSEGRSWRRHRAPSVTSVFRRRWSPPSFYPAGSDLRWGSSVVLREALEVPEGLSTLPPLKPE